MKIRFGSLFAVSPQPCKAQKNGCRTARIILHRWDIAAVRRPTFEHLPVL